MESWKSRFLRWSFNFLPAFRSTGAWITYISPDFREIRVRLRLFWRTRNYVGTLYGGALYSAVDGIPMVMLINLLGSEYIVWDKNATIRFLKPGRSTVYATIRIPQEETDAIVQETDLHQKCERPHLIHWLDGEGTAIATVEQLLYVRKK